MLRRKREAGERPLSPYASPLSLKSLEAENFNSLRRLILPDLKIFAALGRLVLTDLKIFAARRLVGRTPWSAADAHVGLFSHGSPAGPGVRRGRGRPPYEKMELFPAQH